MPGVFEAPPSYQDRDVIVEERMDRKWALDMAQDWIDSWNSHDLNRILSHYTDDFEMSSPIIAQLMGLPSGRLVGKEVVGDYWRVALSRIPNLHFELITVFTSSNSIVIHYRNQAGTQAAEVLFLDFAGKVVRATAHYAT